MRKLYPNGALSSLGELGAFRNLAATYGPCFEGGEGDPPAPKPDETTVDLDDPKVKEAIDAIVAEQVKGLKAKNEQVIGENRTLSEKVREMAEAVKAFEGLGDPEKIRAVMKRIEESEEARLISEGKLDEVVAKKFELKEAAFLKQIEELNAKLQELDGIAAKWRTGHNNLKIETAVSAAADALKLFAYAKPDALAAARGRFSVNDEGNIVALDKDGQVITSKDGKSPLQPQEWLEGMKNDRPHWWPAPQGGGAIPGERQDSGVTGFSTEQLQDMTQDEYIRYRKEGRIK